MIDMEISKPLDKALNFNQENFFEYMDVLLHNMNTEIIGSQSIKTTRKRLIKAILCQNYE